MKRILVIAAKDILILVFPLLLDVLYIGSASETRADTTTVALRPILDTHFTPTASYGSSTAVQVRGSTGHKGFLKFSFSTIPPNSTIVWANLKIKVTGVSTGSFKLYKVLKDWDETATWTRTSATGGTSWGTAGAGPGTDYDTTWIDGHVYRPDATGTLNIPLSAAGVSLLQKQYAGTVPNYGMVLVDDSAANTDALSFGSSEASLANRPQLEISYIPNTPSTFKVAFWNLDVGCHDIVDTKVSRHRGQFN